MENLWSDKTAREFIESYGAEHGEDVALRLYTSRLLGSERSLVLHGGGNTSVKGSHANLLGESMPAIYVKGSGRDMSTLDPESMPGLRLEHLYPLRKLTDMADAAMANELRANLFDSSAPTPSIEALMHVSIPAKFIDHTHADAILTLTNQENGEQLILEALGDDVIILGYVKAGFKLAKAAADAFDANPNARGMVLMHHGLVTWGETAKDTYDAMIEVVSKAESYIAAHTSTPLAPSPTTPEQARSRLITVAPVIRGLLSTHGPVVLRPLITREALDLVDSDRGKVLALSAPLTPDHLIRTKSLPMWVDSPDYDNPAHLREQLTEAIAHYSEQYEAYIARHSDLANGVTAFDPLPRAVMMPGLGVICAGTDSALADIACDITEQAIAAKFKIAAMGGVYRGLSETDLFNMEYHPLQHAKLACQPRPALAGKVGFVTGAAGAIGSGICRGLLREGCHVAVTDLPGPNLDSLVEELKSDFGGRVIGLPMDVTDPDSVMAGIDSITQTWGGVDIAIVNAGVAHVSALKDMDLSAFQRLERINVEGTLLVLKHIAAHFELQGIGGDIVLVSTKNIFSPGATFGAYSATKAASHQLARIASLELAPIGVRVNMVAPDAVFSDGERKSGLWQEVGPGRMKARGLDEKGLEEYYQSRNLLKARVTADHVANAVLFFVTHQTPTTGATIPVDGGLPDATPR